MAEKTWSWPGAWPERKMAQKLKNVTQKSWRHKKIMEKVPKDICCSRFLSGRGCLGGVAKSDEECATKDWKSKDLETS